MLFSAVSAQDLPCVGDWVLVQYHNDGTLAIVHEVLPRKTFLRRKAAGMKVDYQIIASNIDTAFLMQSCDLNFNLRRMERYLVMVEEGGAESVILLSKSDLVTPEELEEATPESSRLIQVHEFVRSSQIDPLFLEHGYYLEPDSSPPGFNEFVEALQELEVAGICTWTMRKRSYLGAVQAQAGILRLTTLRYADEVVAVSALGLQEIPVTEKELQIGRDLISQLTAPFLPQKFVNEHEQKLKALIDKKARGEKVVLLRPKVLKPTAAGGLLKALEASLKKVA